MKRMVWISLITLVQLLTPLTPTAAGAIRVMILDGQSGGPYHDWQHVTPVLRKEISASLRMVALSSATSSRMLSEPPG